MNKKKGQQEIVGFVLIVVLVMVGMMIFLIISVRDSVGDESDSGAISNMLDAILRTTSECAIVYEPDYDSYADLLKSCYQGKSCSNLDVSACDYLSTGFGEIVAELARSEGNMGGYEVDFFVPARSSISSNADVPSENPQGASRGGEGLLQWSGGNCSAFSAGAQKTIVSRSTSLVVRMRICGLV